MRVLENVDRRVLAAVRFIDVATRLPVRAPLIVGGAPLRWVTNRSGLHVVLDAPGLAAFAAQFEPPAAPAPLSVPFTLTVHDPREQWLPRVFRLALPRDPDVDPARRADPGSVYVPRDVELYPSPSARVTPVGARLRVVVPESAGADAPPLVGALVRVVAAADGAVLGRGLTNEWGEALIVVPDVPLVGWSADDTTSPVSSTTAVVIQVAANPTAELPDPEQIEEDWATNHLAARDRPSLLAWGREDVERL